MTDEQIIEAWKVAGRLDTVGDNLQQAVAMVRALLADGGKGEAVYQVRLANGSWQDTNERAYQYNSKHCPEDTRIVYTAPQAECAPRADAERHRASDDSLSKDAALTDAEIMEHFETHAIYALEGKKLYWGQALPFARAILAANKEPQP